MTTEAGDPIPPQDRLFQHAVKQIGSERIATEFMTLPISDNPLPLTILVVCRHHEYWSEVGGSPQIIWETLTGLGPLLVFVEVLTA
jgi:hypothetical protein